MTAAAIAVGLVVFGVGAIFFVAFRAGSDAVEKAFGDQNVKAAKRIEDAGVIAPHSRSDLSDRLSKPGGKL